MWLMKVKSLSEEKNVNNVPPEKRNTAMCFQSYALFPHLNVSHNICYGLKQRKIDIEEQKTAFKSCIETNGLRIS